MSLNQKYTWGDFLKENPELKKKGIKRTSSEGKKAFNSAYKTKMKGYLADRAKRLDVSKKKATEKMKTLTEKVKSFQKAKKYSQAKVYQQKVGRQDAWLARLYKEAARIKTLQKSF